MEVKAAVKVAKSYVLELFGDDGVSNVGLEEVVPEGACWKITIGFSPGWSTGIGAILGGVPGRSYKVLIIDKETEEVLSVTDRFLSKGIL